MNRVTITFSRTHDGRFRATRIDADPIETDTIGELMDHVAAIVAVHLLYDEGDGPPRPTGKTSVLGKDRRDLPPMARALNEGLERFFGAKIEVLPSPDDSEGDRQDKGLPG